MSRKKIQIDHFFFLLRNILSLVPKYSSEVNFFIDLLYRDCTDLQVQSDEQFIQHGSIDEGLRKKFEAYQNRLFVFSNHLLDIGMHPLYSYLLYASGESLVSTINSMSTKSIHFFSSN